MKRCPQCDRLEPDDALAFCRADGKALVSDSSSLDSEDGTARLTSAPVVTEIETSILAHTTDSVMSRATAPTTVLPTQQPPSTTSELIKPKRRKAVFVGALLFAALVAAAIVISGYFYYSRKTILPSGKVCRDFAEIHIETPAQ